MELNEVKNLKFNPMENPREAYFLIFDSDGFPNNLIKNYFEKYINFFL